MNRVGGSHKSSLDMMRLGGCAEGGPISGRRGFCGEAWLGNFSAARDWLIVGRLLKEGGVNVFGWKKNDMSSFFFQLHI